MSGSVTDRRIQKTRQLLKDALISLMLEKGFEAVTIQEVLDRANVGRSTFYFHFENKQALLHSCFEEFHELFEKHDVAGKSFADVSKSSFILDLFRIVERNQKLCRALLGSDDMMMFFSPVHGYIYGYVGDHIKAFIPGRDKASLKADMLINYISSALIGTIRWWVQNDMPCSAEEMDKYVKQLVHNNIKVLA